MLNIPLFQIRFLISPKWTSEACNNSNITNSSHSTRPCSNNTTSSRRSANQRPILRSRDLNQPMRGWDSAQQPIGGQHSSHLTWINQSEARNLQHTEHYSLQTHCSYCIQWTPAQTRMTLKLLSTSFCKPTPSYYDVSILYFIRTSNYNNSLTYVRNVILVKPLKWKAFM